MKRFIAIMLTLAAVIVCFSSCGKSEEAKAVIEKINAIGEITLEKESLIAEAENAYTQLSEKDKKAVAFKILELARKDLEDLKEFSKDAEEVLAVYEKALTEYGTPESTITDSYKALSDKLADCYESIKAECEKIFEAVKEKNEEYEKISADAVLSAKAYVNYFKELNADKQIDIKDIGCIAQISDGTVYYLFALTYNDGGEDVNAYSTVRFAGVPAKETMDMYAEKFYSEAPSSEKADALTMGNVSISLSDIK